MEPKLKMVGYRCWSLTCIWNWCLSWTGRPESESLGAAIELNLFFPYTIQLFLPEMRLKCPLTMTWELFCYREIMPSWLNIAVSTKFTQFCHSSLWLYSVVNGHVKFHTLCMQITQNALFCHRFTRGVPSPASSVFSSLPSPGIASYMSIVSCLAVCIRRTCNSAKCLVNHNLPYMRPMAPITMYGTKSVQKWEDCRVTIIIHCH